MQNTEGTGAPRVFIFLCDEDSAMAAPVVQALRSSGVRLSFSASADGEAPAQSALCLALVTPAALADHAWRSSFLRAVQLKAPVLCLVHGDAQLTPAMQLLLSSLPAVPFGPECAQQILADERIAGSLCPSARFFLLPKEGPAVPVPPSGLVIGRDPSCGLCLTDPSVSRFHARISFEDGQIGVTDTDSMNGTFLNGILLDSGEICEMEPEDELLFGSCLYLLKQAPAH